MWIYGVDSLSGITNYLYYNITVISRERISVTEELEFREEGTNNLFAYNITIRNLGDRPMTIGNVSALFANSETGHIWVDDPGILFMDLNESASFRLWMRLDDMGYGAGSTNQMVRLHLDWEEGVEIVVFKPPLPRVSMVNFALSEGEENIKETVPGESVSFSVEIENKGNYRDILGFYYTGTGTEWFSSPSPVTLSRILPGNGTSIKIDCLIPANASGSDMAEVFLYAMSDSGILYGPINLTTRVSKNSRSLEFGIPSMKSTGKGGTIWTINIHNRGEVDETVTLETVAPSGWNATVDHKRISMVAGGSADITVTVLPEEDPETGILTIVAHSVFAPEVTDSKELELQPVVSIMVPDGPYITREDLTFSAVNPDISIFIWSIEGLVEAHRDRDFKHSFARPGDYTIGLIGTKGSLDAYTSVTITVMNRAPEITPLEDDNGTVGTYYPFNAVKVASDPDGEIVSYLWTVKRGEEVIAEFSGEMVYHRFTNEGVYTVVLKVTDDSGASAEATFHYSIQDEVAEQQQPGADESNVLHYSLAGILAGIIVLIGLNLIDLKSRGPPAKETGGHHEQSGQDLKSRPERKEQDKRTSPSSGAAAVSVPAERDDTDHEMLHRQIPGPDGVPDEKSDTKATDEKPKGVKAGSESVMEKPGGVDPVEPGGEEVKK